MLLIDNGELLASFDGHAVIYKRWLNHDALLIAMLDVELAHYTLSVYQVSSGTVRQQNIPSDLLPLAEMVSVRSFGNNGELLKTETMLTRPKLYISPDLKHACWLNACYQWSFYDILNGIVIEKQPSSYGQSEACGAWISESEFAVPISTPSGRWFSGMDIYRLSTPAAGFVRTARLGFGRLAGVSASGDLYIESKGRSGQKRNQIKLYQWNLSAPMVKTISSFKVDHEIKMGEVALCRKTSRVARLLSCDDGSRQTYRLSIAEGATETANIDLGELPSPTTEEVLAGAYGIYDLEWTPCGSALTYVYKNKIYNFSI